MCWNGKNVNAVFSNATTRGVWARIGDFGSKYRKKLEKRRSGKVVPGRKAGFNKPPVPDVAISWNAPDSDNAQSDPQWTETVWSSVVTGDLILLHNNDSIPADIIVLSTSEPDGLCYVETKNLDGETNLKIRRGIAETGYLSPAGTEDLKDFRCVVESEAPNNNLYTFLGALVLPPITEAEADVEKGDGEDSVLVTEGQHEHNRVQSFGQATLTLQQYASHFPSIICSCEAATCEIPIGRLGLQYTLAMRRKSL